MEKRIKQSVGIDCGQKELVVAYGVMDENYDAKILSNTKFSNNERGFEKLLAWSRKLNPENAFVSYVIEATGVYHERFSLYLHEQDCKITVLLPNKSKAFMKTLSVKTVNDKVSAQMLAQFGLEKKLEYWQPPHQVYNELRQLTRERDQLMGEQTQVKNQLHAEQSGAWPNKGSIKRMNQRIRFLAKQIEQIENEINAAIEKQPWLKEKIKNVCTIKGVGILTAVIVIAETNGFNLIRNKKQLVSYAGLDVITKDSGTSVKSKPRISRKGNKYLRKCLHYPALAAIGSTDPMKALFARLVSKHGIKMKGVVAVQRKLLELIYILWKTDAVYNPNYQAEKKERATGTGHPCELTFSRS
jgi:transposase